MDTPNSILEPIKVSAPGKIILFGEHSVVYGKLALAATLGLRTKVTIESYNITSNNSEVMFDFLTLNKIEKFKLNELKNEIFDKILINYKEPKSVNHSTLINLINTYLKQSENNHLTSLLFLMAAILNDLNDIPPFLLKIQTDLTISSGLGSSASYLVTLTAGFLQLRKLLTHNDLINKKFNNFDMDLIEKWSFEAEKIHHGTPSGIDNTTCTYGGLVQFQKGTKFNVLTMAATNLKILLINSNVKRNTKDLAGLVRKLYEKHTTIIDLIFDAINEITKKAIETIESNQLNDLNDLIDLNQNLLCCLNVSHVKLNEICMILKRYQLNGKLTGAGGGGYVISIIPTNYVGSIDVVVNELELNGFNATLTDLGGMGVTID